MFRWHGGSKPSLTLTVMAPSRGSLPRSLHVALGSHKGAVNVARYSKGTASYILTGGQDRSIRLWNANLGTEIKSFNSHGYEVLSISVYALCWLFAVVSKLPTEPMIMQNSPHQAETALSLCGTLLPE